MGAPLRGRSVAIVTRDASTYADIAQVLKERRWPSVSLLPGEKVPERVAVVLTTPDEARAIRHSRVMGVPPEGDRTALWAAVECALAAESAESELVVGFDPGPRPGYAVVIEGRILAEGNLESPEGAATLGHHLKRSFPDRELRFRVGSGDPRSRDRVLESLLPLRRPVELVNEAGTTPDGRRPKDAAAARAIARLRGRVVRGVSSSLVTPGEIANVQRLSREGSGGRFTISRADAGRVVRGELTLAQALDEGHRRYAGQPHRPSSDLRRERS